MVGQARLNSRSPGPKPEAKAYRIRLDLSAESRNRCKSLNTVARWCPLCDGDWSRVLKRKMTR